MAQRSRSAPPKRLPSLLMTPGTDANLAQQTLKSRGTDHDPLLLPVRDGTASAVRAEEIRVSPHDKDVGAHARRPGSGIPWIPATTGPCLVAYCNAVSAGFDKSTDAL